MEPLKLEHKAFIEEKLKKLNFLLSEYDFVNLYLFRKLHDYELHQGEVSFLKGVTYDQTTFLLPLDQEGDYRPYLKEHQAVLFPIPEEELSRYPGWKAEYSVDDSDYLYCREKMCTYPGRKLDGRRNLVKQFSKKYPFEVIPMSEETVDLAKDLLNEWRKEREKLLDYDEALEALQLFKFLELEGIMILSEGKPIAYILGTPMSKECYLVHFAKALSGYTGVHQFLYQAMAKQVHPSLTWMNLEADMGIEGLRASKRAYHPDKMGIKWRLKFS